LTTFSLCKAQIRIYIWNLF